MTLNKNSKYIIAYNESAIYAAECFAKVIKEFIKITHKKFSIKISHNEYLLLEQILLNPGITQGDLARKISIQRNYVSKLLSALENNGYITREQKTKSKQIIAVKNYITKKGEEIYKESRDIIVREAMLLFTEEEIDELNDISKKLFKQIDKIKKNQNIKF